MTHSDAFNARRKAEYRLARQIGLSPRDAGHIYNEGEREAKVAKAYAQRIPTEMVKVLKSPAERQAESGINPERYHFHSYYGGYARVRIDVVDEMGNPVYRQATDRYGRRLYHKDGTSVMRRVYHNLTVTFEKSDTPTLGEVYENARRVIRENNAKYENEGQFLSGFTLQQFDSVPNRESAHGSIYYRELAKQQAAAAARATQGAPPSQNPPSASTP